MPITPDTRKPVDDLTVEDFLAYPIWEFALDEEGIEGRDETWVRPVDSKQVPKGEYSQLVGSEFVTAGGENLHGFMVVSTCDGVEVQAGSLVGDGYYLPLPQMSEENARKDAPWEVRARHELEKALGGRGLRVFPLSYTLRAAIQGETVARSGVVE